MQALAVLPHPGNILLPSRRMDPSTGSSPSVLWMTRILRICWGCYHYQGRMNHMCFKKRPSLKIAQIMLNWVKFILHWASISKTSVEHGARRPHSTDRSHWMNVEAINCVPLHLLQCQVSLWLCNPWACLIFVILLNLNNWKISI